ncbi:universal stress protein [Oceanihabitans sediminis]|uniref:Universal stress protein n=1 Tax=Oceanihabitans sediminis TaxID=1812012 RepID=A0A368P3H3_9FLAO|nr:universal stress protein [Oceanihabitans sediminis]MDX1278245.1 universal stress protein [Oceanihabitans sediminis]MDX1774611.1 universal stress protein [Oceanihabitans sediminis]RBP28992.1 nucleotide-binding universal stress UspA family protein [Oceanihabitans sediminis]RCU57078.1 universal stress protein [Oceanihabitans sediminis]
MKKIIVPIDFSEHSEYALETAAVFAKKYNAEILALHMLELSNAVLTSTGDSQQMETVFYLRLAKQKFKDFLDKDYLKGIKVTPIVKHFKVFSEISEVGKEHNVDLIIMGSQGTSGLKEVFIGSNTEKVVRHSEIPVLVIKHSPILTNFDHIVFACDFSEESINPYLKASKMCEGLDATMHLVYVNLPDNRFRSSTEIEKRVATFLKTADGNIDKMKNVAYVNDYTIEKGILNYANVIGADLIAVATHGRTGLAHFFEGSVSEDIANHSTLPVMTFKI